MLGRGNIWLLYYLAAVSLSFTRPVGRMLASLPGGSFLVVIFCRVNLCHGLVSFVMGS